MKNGLTLATLIALSTVFAGSAAAETVAAQRNINQQKRINQGVQSGQLTPRETARLQREQAHIQNMETRAAADGTVTKAEKARINRAQNRASRDIYRQKHDAQTVAQ